MKADLSVVSGEERIVTSKELFVHTPEGVDEMDVLRVLQETIDNNNSENKGVDDSQSIELSFRE